MIRYLKRLWNAAPVASVLLALALLVAVGFGARMALHPPHFSDAKRGDQPVAAWMTPGYIGHAYQIPRAQVIEALNVPIPPPRGPMTLTDLAAYRDVPLEIVLEEARLLVERAKEQRTP